ncbi:cellulase family glycosylhydrolase [Streptomyces sp. NPDC058301]|uniref:cellulase family glycosylhydrolase n=1 Tax=Streptomyces sp. NPDC058301 TaxID=3346436 RepID=UPI0036E6F5C3
MNDSQQTARPRSRRLVRTAGLVVALATTGSVTCGTAIAAPADPAQSQGATGKAPRSAMDAVTQMQPSWNLGNTLDAIPDETSWGNPLTTKALIDHIPAEGFRSIRIPVSWYPHQSETAPYTIDAAYMKRVKQVVDWALEDGLYVDLNVHHDSWKWVADISTNHDGVMARFNSTWRQIATTFKNEPSKLLLESINEPVFNNATDAQKTQYLNELNTSFHSIVRESGGKNKDRLLILPTQGGSGTQPLMDDLSKTINSLHDRNLVATVHYYSFWPFSVNVAGYTTYTADTRKDMLDSFARMRDTFISKGVPVYLGEYGLLTRPTEGYVERGEMLKYYEELGYQARISGVTGALWDDFAFLNRADLKWRDPELMNLVKQSWQTRSGTASTDNLFLPKAGPIKAQTVTLNPNGTKPLTVWHGNTPLREGPDYTIKDNQLTLTGDALTRLAGDRHLGVNTTVEVWFSPGVPWQLHVNTSDQPQLSNAAGTDASLDIPSRFNGDLLATMEAKYADGTNAGPAAWTPYQQFGYSFAPKYDANTTALTADFLKALKDGAPATLTFHYWSGATVTGTAS